MGQGRAPDSAGQHMANISKAHANVNQKLRDEHEAFIESVEEELGLSKGHFKDKIDLKVAAKVRRKK